MAEINETFKGNSPTRCYKRCWSAFNQKRQWLVVIAPLGAAKRGWLAVNQKGGVVGVSRDFIV